MEREFNPLFFCFISLGLAAFLIVNSARAPLELFLEQKKKVIKPISKTPYIAVEKAAPTKPISISRQLLPKPVATNNLLQLSAGLISNNNSGNTNGLNVTQGEQSTNALMESSSRVNQPISILQSNPPIYPSQAQNQGIEGYVIAQIDINNKSEIVNVVILESKPAGIFDAAALAAIKQWKFSSAIENNRPITSSLKQRIKFELD